MDKEFARHWTVLLAAGSGVMLGISAIPAFVLGVFAGPKTREFGWSLGAYQAGTLVLTLGILICSSWIGGLCDRHGARAVAMAGMPLGAIGVALLALVQSPAWSWWLLMFVAALLGSGTLPTVWMRMVNGLFVRRRGPTHREALRRYCFWVVALGFAAVTVGVGGMNFNFEPILVSKGISTRDAAQLFGTMAIAIAIAVRRLAVGALSMLALGRYPRAFDPPPEVAPAAA